MRRWWMSMVCVMSLVWGAIAEETPRVVVSIKPLHSLVSGVMQGVGKPHLLMSGQASPHTYAFRPSDVRALQQATLVFWTGEAAEPTLPRFLQSLPDSVRVVEGMQVPGLLLRPTRHQIDAPGASPPTAHAHEDELFLDPHLWLDPHNARLLVQEITEQLSRLDPERATRYANNRIALDQRLTILDEQLREQLLSVKEKPYLVFHDAYQYFEQRYGLSPVGWITAGPDRPPGAGHLRMIRETLRRSGARCVFSEPQFPPRILSVVTEDLPVRVGTLDPVGAELEEGPDLYFELLQGLGGALHACLSAAAL